MNTTIIVAVIAVLICICFIILGGVAFYMNQAKLKKSTESPESPESPESESESESESDETSSTVNVKIGEVIGCRTSNPKGDLRAIYRYVGDKKIRYYPNEEIFNSWGSTAGDGPIRGIDCTGFTLGADMEKKI